MRILVIDDSDDYRWIVKRLLEQNGYEVLEASNAKDGIEITAKYFINLVITDLYMPDIDGIQTIKIMNEKFPGIRIIAMTGACSEGRCLYIFGLAKEKGAVDVFSKDEDLSVLLGKVNSILSKCP